jgi:hypothetical protein
VKIRHALLFAFALIGVFIALDMTGITRGIPDFVIEVAMILPCLALITYIVKRQAKP